MEIMVCQIVVCTNNRVELLYCKECVWSFWVCFGCIWHSKFITHISTQNLHLLLRKVVVHHLKPNDQPTQKGSFQAEGHRNKFCQDIVMMPSFKRKKSANWAQLRSQTLSKLTLGELHASAIQPWLVFNFQPSPCCEPLVRPSGKWSSKLLIQAHHGEHSPQHDEQKLQFTDQTLWELLLIAPHKIVGISEFLVTLKKLCCHQRSPSVRTGQLRSLKLTWPRNIGRAAKGNDRLPTIPFLVLC